MNRFCVALCCFACTTILAASPTRASDAPATAPAAAAPARTMAQINSDFVPVVRGIAPAYDARRDWSDPVIREKLAPTVRPFLKKVLPLLDEINQAGRAREGDEEVMYEMASLFGDADLRARVTLATQRPAPRGSWAKAAQLAAAFYQADGDPKGQARVLGQMEQLAKTDLAMQHALIWAADDIYQNAAPSKEIAERLDFFVTTTLQSDSLTPIKAARQNQRKQLALLNKPLVLSGVLRDGTKFTSADMKGKVILVDFWASWCGPCKAELPRVKKMYAEYHDKGLEVVGVSCDFKAHDLEAYLAKNPDMPWPQLFDKNAPGWHALTKQFGITAIPTMYLIDKKGICRSITARPDFELQIPKLLAEPSSGSVTRSAGMGAQKSQ